MVQHQGRDGGQPNGTDRSCAGGFDDTLQSCISEAGFENRLDRVVLVGFSQGSIMALDAAISGRWPVAGVAAFSGRLASPPSMLRPREHAFC
ncbi:hypothetical protein RAA17_05855 [Komagataeibacter rhaeticus]|nr:hypothetical protein [Komagataeibacter rhaeticus]